MITGDFDFLSGDDRVFKVGVPTSPATTTSTTTSSGSHRTAWMISFYLVGRNWFSPAPPILTPKAIA